MAAPNRKELEIVALFREKLRNLNLDEDKNTDMYLLRWLRAREYNLDQAEQMLRKSLIWRQENDIDSLLTWVAPENLTKNYKLEFSGFDKEKSPVAILQFGKWDIKKLIESGQKVTYLRYIDQIFEKLLDAMKGKETSNGVAVTQFIAILDMNCLSMKTLFSFGAVDAIMENLKRFECNHPETLKAAYVINASRVFTMLFSIVKPILSQRTFGKVHIYNSDPANWKPALFAAIPRDQLPTIYGGTSKKSSFETTETESNGISKLSLNDDDNENCPHNLIAVTVGAAQILKIEIQVGLEGSVLNWFFKTETFDIGFYVTFLDGEVVTNKRVESHINPVLGTHVCNRVGSYIFHFDNSFSRLRSKVLKYKIDVIEPKPTC